MCEEIKKIGNSPGVAHGSPLQDAQATQFGQTMAAMFTFVQTQASNLGLSGHFTGS